MPARRPAWVVVAGVVLVLLAWWLGVGDDTATDAPRGDDSSQVSAGPERQASEQEPAVDEHGLTVVRLAALPPQAREVLEAIDAGGPYEHPGKDGATFGNYEGVLPQQRRGYYREYTVETPGVAHRGARRIVTGAGGELYWSADHYVSFERIRR